MQRVVAVVGGAGSMGRITVTDLCLTSDKDIQIWVLDRDAARLEGLKKNLQILVKRDQWKLDRVKFIACDLSKFDQMVELLKGATVLVNAVNYQFNVRVMEMALQVGAHYTDLGGLFHITREQLKLDAKFKERHLTAVIGMGAAPGITNVLAKLGAEGLDQVREIHCRVAGVDQTRYHNPPALPVSYSLKTILEEFSKEPAVFSKGEFRFVEPMSGDRPHRFPKPIGLRRPMYTLHSEVATLPISFSKQGVKEVSFKIAFDPEFTERVRFLRDAGLASESPVELGAQKIAPIDFVNQVIMSQPQGKQIGRLKQYEVVRTVLKGTRKSKKLTLILDCHTSGKPDWGIGLDIDTGSPPAVCAQMILDGLIAERGVVPPEQALPPQAFFDRLKKRQMYVKVSRRPGWTFAT